MEARAPRHGNNYVLPRDAAGKEKQLTRQLEARNVLVADLQSKNLQMKAEQAEQLVAIETENEEQAAQLAELKQMEAENAEHLAAMENENEQLRLQLEELEATTPSGSTLVDAAAAAQRPHPASTPQAPQSNLVAGHAVDAEQKTAELVAYKTFLTCALAQNRRRAEAIRERDAGAFLHPTESCGSIDCQESRFHQARDTLLTPVPRTV